MNGRRLRHWLLAPMVSYAALITVITWYGSYNLVIGVLVAHILVAVAVPSVVRFSRHDDNPRRLAQILVGGLAAKMLASLVQYWLLSRVYAGDAAGYYNRGRVIGAALRADEPVVLVRKIPGTGFIDWLTGVVCSVIGPSMLGAFLIFSFWSFLGSLFFYNAFRVAVPRADARRYLVLALFLPSVLFWPSALGKDAWVMFTLGMSAYGAAALLGHRTGGFLWLLFGLAGTALVRPHVALLFTLSLAATYLVSPSRRRSFASPITKLVGMVVLLGISVVLLHQFQAYIGEAVGPGPLVSDSLEYVDQTTSSGASAYESVGGRTIQAIPAAVLSVLFRPWLFEARNPLMLLAALEGTGLLVFVVRTLARRFRAVVRRCREHPYAILAVIYIVLFSLVFSNLGNFGLLVRQRTQVLPFVLVIIALNWTGRSKREAAQADTGARPESEELQSPTPVTRVIS